MRGCRLGLGGFLSVFGCMSSVRHMPPPGVGTGSHLLPSQPHRPTTRPTKPPGTGFHLLSGRRVRTLNHVKTNNDANHLQHVNLTKHVPGNRSVRTNYDANPSPHVHVGDESGTALRAEKVQK